MKGRGEGTVHEDCTSPLLRLLGGLQRTLTDRTSSRRGTGLRGGNHGSHAHDYHGHRHNRTILTRGPSVGVHCCRLLYGPHVVGQGAVHGRRSGRTLHWSSHWYLQRRLQHPRRRQVLVVAAILLDLMNLPCCCYLGNPAQCLDSGRSGCPIHRLPRLRQELRMMMMPLLRSL